jgi:hypothetical protein
MMVTASAGSVPAAAKEQREEEPAFATDTRVNLHPHLRCAVLGTEIQILPLIGNKF